MSYAGRELSVNHTGDKQFSIEDNGHTLQLQLQRDNEGAVHWLDRESEQETELSKDIGIQIEKYFTEKNNPL
ncbi:MAG: hypothetical protein JWN76_806 [Chitinophagaceae bacterium]|nr:hypothetical protein [Chitinophagaceae bacterium]